MNKLTSKRSKAVDKGWIKEKEVYKVERVYRVDKREAKAEAPPSLPSSASLRRSEKATVDTVRLRRAANDYQLI